MRAAIATLLLGLVAAPGAALAQSEAQLWSSASLENDLGDRLELELEQHLRFDDNSSRFGSLLTDVGLTYELFEWLRFGGGYRFGYQRDGSGDLVVRHRLHAQGQLRAEPADKLRLSLRSRWQETLRGAAAGDGVRHKWRNRFEAEYRATKRLTPGASLELFHAVGNGDGIVLDTLRLTFGADYELTKTSELGAFYRYEQPQADPTDPTLHIVGVSYGYTL